MQDPYGEIIKKIYSRNTSAASFRHAIKYYTPLLKTLFTKMFAKYYPMETFVVQFDFPTGTAPRLFYMDVMFTTKELNEYDEYQAMALWDFAIRSNETFIVHRTVAPYTKASRSEVTFFPNPGTNLTQKIVDYINPESTTYSPKLVQDIERGTTDVRYK